MLLFVDESGTDRREAPYEVLAGSANPEFRSETAGAAILMKQPDACVENHSALLGEFLDQALTGLTEQLRPVAQTLAGPALAGEGPRLTTSRGAKAAALRKLTGNWHSLVQDNLFRRGV